MIILSNVLKGERAIIGLQLQQSFLQPPLKTGVTFILRMLE